jgi:tetratricopeptide (TPR) repeat protein
MVLGVAWIMNQITTMMRERLVIIILLIGAVVAVFWPSIHHGFVQYDDADYLVNVPEITSGLNWNSFLWAWTTFHSGNWIPLTWLSHMVDWQLFGGRAGWHHAESILLHALSAALVFVVLRRASGALWPAAFVAAVFAIHPLRVESVAWAAERKDVLSTFLGLLAILGYLKYSDRPSVWRYAAVAGLFALSLLAKSMLVTLPVLLLLLDYWPLNRMSGPSGELDLRLLGRRIFEKAPLLLLSVFAGVMTYLAQRQQGNMEWVGDLSLIQRLAHVPITYVRYLGKLFWPSNLAVLYPYPRAVSVAGSLAALSFLLAVTFLACWQSRRRPFLIVGWLWFAVALLPVIGVIQVGLQSMADRYTYVPSIGIGIMVAWSAGEWMRHLSRASRGAVAGLAILVLICLAAQARHQVGFWRDTNSLYGRALAVTHNNWKMHLALAGMLEWEGKTDEAFAHIDRAAAIYPEHPDVQFALAESLLKRNRVDDAMDAYARVVERRADHADGLNNLAWLLATHPDPVRRNGTLAIAYAQKANDLSSSKNAAYMDTLAAAYAETRQFDRAIAIAKESLAIANENNQVDLVRIIWNHLSQFQNNQPIRMQLQ